jgi:hypothetical protein
MKSGLFIFSLSSESKAWLNEKLKLSQKRIVPSVVYTHAKGKLTQKASIFIPLPLCWADV